MYVLCFFIPIEMFKLFLFCFLKLRKIECKTDSFHVHWKISIWRSVSLLLRNIFIFSTFTIFYSLFATLSLSLSGISINCILTSLFYPLPLIVLLPSFLLIYSSFLIPWWFHFWVASYFVVLRIPVRLAF